MSTRNRRPFTAYATTVELEFRVPDERCFLVAESGRLDCELVVDESIRQSGGNTILFVSVYDASATRVVSDALESTAAVDARHIGTADDGVLVELVVTSPSLARSVADSRAVAHHISAEQGTGHVVVEVPPSTTPQQVIEMFTERHADATLVARREHEPGPSLAASEFRERLLVDLTDRQREALQTAYRQGYFDVPRETTAGECAMTLGVSQSTFSQHLNVALRKVLDALLGANQE